MEERKIYWNVARQTLDEAQARTLSEEEKKVIAETVSSITNTLLAGIGMGGALGGSLFWKFSRQTPLALGIYLPLGIYLGSELATLSQSPSWVESLLSLDEHSFQTSAFCRRLLHRLGPTTSLAQKYPQSRVDISDIPSSPSMRSRPRIRSQRGSDDINDDLDNENPLSLLVESNSSLDDDNVLLDLQPTPSSSTLSYEDYSLSRRPSSQSQSEWPKVQRSDDGDSDPWEK